MKAITIEGHFPWYADPDDTTNIDCQCGQPCDGLAGWSTHIANETTVGFVEAAQKFIKSWGSSTLALDLGRLFPCKEVEALAGMLTALGATAAGQAWIDAHSPDDGCEDMHCGCGECGDNA
jgi:hypothetical protein